MKFEIRKPTSLGFISAALVALPLVAYGASNGASGEGYPTAPSSPTTQGDQTTVPDNQQRGGDINAPNVNDSTNGARSSGQLTGDRHAQGDQQVRAVQQALNSSGASLHVDGVLGPQTRKALRSYQEQNGLPATGQVDQPTKQKLNINNNQ